MLLVRPAMLLAAACICSLQTAGLRSSVSSPCAATCARTACCRSAQRSDGGRPMAFRLELKGGEGSDSLFDVGDDSAADIAPSMGEPAPDTKRPRDKMNDAPSEREQLRALATVSDISDSSVELVNGTGKVLPGSTREFLEGTRRKADNPRPQTRAKTAISAAQDSDEEEEGEEEGGSESGADSPASREGSGRQPRGKQPAAQPRGKQPAAQGRRGGVPIESGSSVPDEAPNALLEVDDLGAGLAVSSDEEYEAARTRLAGGSVSRRKVPSKEQQQPDLTGKGLQQAPPRGTEPPVRGAHARRGGEDKVEGRKGGALGAYTEVKEQERARPGGAGTGVPRSRQGGPSEEDSGGGGGGEMSSIGLDALIEADCAGDGEDHPSGFGSSEDTASPRVPRGSAPKDAKPGRRASVGDPGRGGNRDGGAPSKRKRDEEGTRAASEGGGPAAGGAVRGGKREQGARGERSEPRGKSRRRG